MRAMKTSIINLSSAIIIGFLIALPFTVLELATMTDGARSRLSNGGFVFLWLIPMLFTLVLIPMVRQIRAGDNLMTNPLSLALKVFVLTILTWGWGDFIIDQWPCFLGATGC